MKTVCVSPETLKSRLGSKRNVYMHCRVIRKSISFVNMNSWIIFTTFLQIIDVIYRQVLGKEKKVNFNELHLDYRLCWIEISNALRFQNIRSCL